MKDMPRRKFLEGLLAGAALLQVSGGNAGETTATDAATSPSASGVTPRRRIKLGLIGCGGRGSWLANFFRDHGGYEFVAVADYFPDRATTVGATVGVPAERCFSGLSGYKKVIDSGIEAIALETPPCFFPTHAAAAVEAGLHVYMAKPVAVDVPGTLRIGDLAKQSSKARRVLHVDYQIPTDPTNQDVVQRIRDGGLGKLQALWTCGVRDEKGFSDPPLTSSIESRLKDLVWTNDDAIGGSYFVNYDIHIIDAVIWALARRPVSAFGKGTQCRKDPHGDTLDTYSVTYLFDDGIAWHHQAATGPTHDWITQPTLDGSIQGNAATARLSYNNKAYLRGGDKHVGAKQVENLYEAGAKRNIADFYDRIVHERYDNDTAARSMDTTLTSILGRDAARRGEHITMEQLLRENKSLDVDLSGLKA